MGLTIIAVNKNYGFKKDGKEKKNNKEYNSTETGYFSYKSFREDFMSYLTNKEINTFEELFSDFFPECYWIKENQQVIMNVDDFEEKKKNKPKVLDYLKKLELLKEKYPNLYDCFAFIVHCDCEGEIPFQQLVPLVPHLEEYHKQTGRKWGYSGWDYDWVQELIDCCNETINHNGKLYFC